ncbi:hypothetical protein M878_25865 [Streptomyces roseochromogenus subsp. oscitans DS 12.976]|uniref:Uncharacterized protein n=1 Tax=Streptomyces roseochromogenus subsp. oscitans DS 12.976 TaxID=1352936 RepID=V6K5U7_STRRC|nr:hypothetical protein M878_25865 [Streptomyces roseochromogenus subsp. oscitans DS 12.976]
MTPIPTLSQSPTEGTATIASPLLYLRTMRATSHDERHLLLPELALCVGHHGLFSYEPVRLGRGQP